MISSPASGSRSNLLGRVLHPAGMLAMVVALLALYSTVLHPWMNSWGATEAEQYVALPGDELPADPANYRTKAINIDAPPQEVWSWIIQIGQDRAGFYSNDYLENLAGGDIHNVDEIRPEWQSRAVGDMVPMARSDILGGALGDAIYLPIGAIEPGVMITKLPGRFVLLPREDGTTRLLLREVYDGPVMGEAFAFWVYDPMHFVMEQRMLRGIKERAEGQPLVPGWLALIARAGWVMAGVTVAALFLSRRRWIPVGLVCAALMVPSFSSTGDFDAALAGFLALGISLLGAMVFGRRWLVAYPLVAALVLLVLLLSPDSWTVVGSIFGPVAVMVAWRGHVARGQAMRSQSEVAGGLVSRRGLA
jgi:hypothetical protein